MEGDLFAPSPSIREQPQKGPSWLELMIKISEFRLFYENKVHS